MRKPDQPLIGAKVPSEYVKGPRKDDLLDGTIGMPPLITCVESLVWTDQRPYTRGKLALATTRVI